MFQHQFHFLLSLSCRHRGRAFHFPFGMRSIYFSLSLSLSLSSRPLFGFPWLLKCAVYVVHVRTHIHNRNMRGRSIKRQKKVFSSDSCVVCRRRLSLPLDQIVHGESEGGWCWSFIKYWCSDNGPWWLECTHERELFSVLSPYQTDVVIVPFSRSWYIPAYLCKPGVHIRKRGEVVRIIHEIEKTLSLQTKIDERTFGSFFLCFLGTSRKPTGQSYV